MGSPEQDEVRFRKIRLDDRPEIQAISDATWDGEDFLARVFDAWTRDPASHFLGIEVRGRIVGCGRLLPLDARRAWLEGLRVHPSAQGRGLGRRMSHHLFRLGGTLGFEELYFSTYFENEASIAIAEAAGFRPVALFSFLEKKLVSAPHAAPPAEATASGTAIPAADATPWPAADAGARKGAAAHPPSVAAANAPPAARREPGFRSLPGWMANDWLFLPDDLPDRERWFRRSAVVTDGRLTLVVAENMKFPESCLEIAGLEGDPAADPRGCLESAEAEARARGLAFLHLMLPNGWPVEPFREFGLRSMERERDVRLYRARTDALLLPPDGPGDGTSASHPSSPR